MVSDPVALVGMACRLPGAPDPATFWANMLARRTSFTDLTEGAAPRRWDHAAFMAGGRDMNSTYARFGAFIDDVDLFAAEHFGIAPRRAEVMDPQQRLMLELTREALADAGHEARPFDRRRTATFVGAGECEYAGILTFPLRVRQMASEGDAAVSVEAARLAARVPPCRAYTLPGSLLNMCASAVAQTFDLGGPALVIEAACASGLAALVQGMRWLQALPTREGPPPLVLVGGVYLALLPDNFVGFARLNALSRGQCRPFDAAAEGFVMGEGAVMVVLKRLSEAVRDGDRIYAVLLGGAINSDGRMDSPATPLASGQVELMRDGFEDAAIEPATVGYVECHGTGTAVGDAVELAALAEVFGDASPRLGSVKANIGHTLPTAGLAGLLRAVLAVYHETLPPQASWERWPEGLAAHPFRIETEASPWGETPRRATVSSFGFGGTNAFVVVEQALSRPPAPPLSAYPFCCSAPTAGMLGEHLGLVATALEAGLDPTGAAWTLTTRAVMPWSAIVVAPSGSAAAQAMRGLVGRLQGDLAGGGCFPEGVILAPGESEDDFSAPYLEGVAHARGGTVDWTTIFPAQGQRIVDVPVAPLPRRRYWAVASG